MKSGIVLSILLFPLSLQAAVTITDTFNVSAVIPDANEVGFSHTYTLTAGENGVPAASDIRFITSVTVDLNFTGGYNGDIYAYLVHGDSGFVILLNRIDRSVLNPDGSASSGMMITFDDSANEDVHDSAPGSGVFTGTYQPDGRNEDPDTVLTSDLRTAFLSSFTNLNAGGDWTLFVADLSPGGESTLQSWGLTITAIPEPSTMWLLLAACLPVFIRRRN